MMGFSIYDLFYLTPEILFVLAGVFLLFIKNQKNLAFFVAIATVAGAMVLNIMMFNTNKNIIFDTYEVSDIGILLRLIILSGTLIFIMSTKEFAEDLEYTNLYYAFLSFASLGMIVLPAANDLLTIFIAFELTSISTYSLPFIDQREENRFEAGIKYFLTGAFSTGLILFGMSYIFGMTGSLNLQEISQGISAFQGTPALYLAFVMIVGGFSYKMALAPFHLWAPDTYTGSPSPVSGYLAGITKKGPFAAGIKLFLLAFASIKFEMVIFFGILAILTMTIGNMAALMQKDVKRMLAFSSVANAGTIFVGFAITNLYGLTGSVIHIWGHLLMTVGAFMVIFYVEKRYGKTDFDSFAGLGKKAPLIALAMAVFMMSLGGIPPLLGFWSKIMIILGAVNAGGYYLILAVALILNSALSLAYYFKVIKYMYMKDSIGDSVKNSSSFIFTKVSIYLTSLILIITGLIPGKLIPFVISAVENFLG